MTFVADLRRRAQLESVVRITDVEALFFAELLEGRSYSDAEVRDILAEIKREQADGD